MEKAFDNDPDLLAELVTPTVKFFPTVAGTVAVMLASPQFVTLQVFPPMVTDPEP